MDYRRKKKALFEYKKLHKKELLVASSLTVMVFSAGMYADQTVKADQVAEQAQVQQQVATDTSSEQAANDLLTTKSDQQKTTTANVTTTTEQTETNTTATPQVETTTTVSNENKEQTTAVDAQQNAETKKDVATQAPADTKVDATVSQVAETDNKSTEVATDANATNVEATQTAVASKVATRAADTPAYFPIGDPQYAKGDAVDVSSYQSWMTQDDFNKLKELGVSSVIVKTTEGTSYVNSAAQKQIHDAREAGLNISVYHYATFNDATSGYAEGQHMATTLQNLNLAKDTLVFADMEDVNTYSVDIADNLNQFWNALDEAGYKNHGVYTYASYLYHDAVINTVGKAKTWLAQYPYEPVRDGYYEKKWRDEGYGAWQFSSTAYIPGREAMGTLDLSTDFNGLLLGSKKDNTTSQVNKDGHWYLVDDETGEYLTGLQKVGDATHYYAPNGQMQYGQQEIDGHWYNFDATTGAMKTGFVTIPEQNETFYYAQNGQMQYGQQKIDGHWYNFDPTNGAMKTGFVTIPEQNKTVYYNGKGQMLYGWQWVDNATRYFDTFDGKMTTGQRKINGHWYLFNGKGEMQRGLQYIPDQKKTVYYNQDGWMLYGWQWVNNATRYFDTFDGKMTTGQRLINGHWYLFNDKGEMQRGFQYIPDQKKTVYYNQDGWMLYGQQKIEGHWYNFDTFDGKMKTGFVTIPEQNKTVYYNEKGQMLYGWQWAGNATRYFDTFDGKMTTGQRLINGHWYLFNDKGEMQRGFQYIPDQKKTVYYNQDGWMLYGEQIIAGKKYYFDPVTGAMK
ncbi:GH25 family lysozyme [Ligilactobacillus faecis]|uniref:GH25 family lysozyme n=1 Tax=Ligilactobacillus faecis TaxID=762833 RepID=A0ABV4DLL8_9LACO